MKRVFMHLIILFVPFNFLVELAKRVF